MLVLVLAVSAVVALVSYADAGTYLHTSGAGEGGPAPVGETFSAGIALTTTEGPSVVLDGASAKVAPGASVQWSLYRTRPGGLGFGTDLGALRPRWPVVAVQGARIAQVDGRPARGATWLIASITAAHPGVYRVENVRVHYHSAWRHRSASSRTWICVLVYPPARRREVFRQINQASAATTDPSTLEPLVAQYNACTGTP